MDEKEAEARPIMGTIFLVLCCRYVSYVKLTAWAELREPNTRMLEVFFKSILFISYTTLEL